jgi:hypothetical protein
MRSSLTSLERLEAQIRALQEGTPQGAAWEAALVRWVNAGGHPENYFEAARLHPK